MEPAIFSKEQRHELYIHALKVYNNMIESNDVYQGFCGTIEDAISDKYDREFAIEYNIYREYNMIKYFPEIGKHYDHLTMADKLYWFPINNTKVRIKILEEAIELTS